MKILASLRKNFNYTQNDVAKEISIDSNTIALYEAGKSKPSFKTLNKLISLFGISWDFFIENNECQYPKNIKLLRLAKKLDEFSKSQERNQIENTAKTFLEDKIDSNLVTKQDIIDTDFTDNFHTNLKRLRQLKNMTQTELGKIINVSRSALALYELRNFPTIDKLIILANFFNISIHALATGEKLSYKFRDEYFGETILLADNLLSIEEHNVLILLMEKIIKSSHFNRPL